MTAVKMFLHVFFMTLLHCSVHAITIVTIYFVDNGLQKKRASQKNHNLWHLSCHSHSTNKSKTRQLEKYPVAVLCFGCQQLISPILQAM